MNLDHEIIPPRRKTNRRRGWRVAALRYLAAKCLQFKPANLAQLCDGMTDRQAQALCRDYHRKGELRLVAKGSPGHTESTYARAT